VKKTIEEIIKELDLAKHLSANEENEDEKGTKNEKNNGSFKRSEWLAPGEENAGLIN
jgi:hypothetical protein